MKKALLMICILLLLIGSASASPCTNIVWGVVSDINGNGIKDAIVILQDVRTSAVIDRVKTDSSGIYLIWSQGNLAGNYSIALEQGTYDNMAGVTNSIGNTVCLIKGKAVRQDLNTDRTKNNRLERDTQGDHIVYITKTGKMYHLYSCQYLEESCIPIPFTLAYYWEYTPCSTCIGK
ncbi:MAG: hypothetical protein ABRQ39_32835 [Candidatus Eremiobacterota bacterium]